MRVAASLTGGSDRGSTAIVVLGVVLAITAVAVGLVDLSLALGARQRAQVAADAAALAAAASSFAGARPLTAASRVAAANGAGLVSCKCPVDRRPVQRAVAVTVAVETRLVTLGAVSLRATSRAAWAP